MTKYALPQIEYGFVRETQLTDYQKNATLYKWRRYKSYDKKRFQTDIIPWELAESLMTGLCFYCGKQASGLDRKDSSIGHTTENVVSCCARCNFLVADLPFEAKLCLCDGLRQISELIPDWQPAFLRKNNT